MTAPHIAREAGELRQRAIEWWGGLPSATRGAVLLGAFGSLDYGLCRFGLALTPGQTSVALFWPAGGLVFGVLLLARRRLWPALLVAAGLPIALFNVLAGQPLVLVLTFAALNALEATLAAALALYLCGGRPQLARPAHVLSIVAAGPVAASGICALISASVVARVYDQPLVGSWWHVWAGSGPNSAAWVCALAKAAGNKEISSGLPSFLSPPGSVTPFDTD